ncbi:MAG: DUF2344 domain-containing protein [Firmicutes bacterium]|nr:DUF2344 domain-containing protein [Bacillota bacterium]
MRLRARFLKEDAVRFISHLDLARTIERAVRRAGLPIAYSQGFSPRPKMAFGSALAVGVTSSAEYIDMEFADEIVVEDCLSLMNQNLPTGIRFKEAVEIGPELPTLMSVIDRASYILTGNLGQNQDLGLKVQRILESEVIWVERPGKKQTRQIDIRPWIFSLEVLKEGAGVGSAALLVQTGSRGNVRPEEVAVHLSWDITRIRIHRSGLFIARGSRLLSPLDVAHC